MGDRDERAVVIGGDAWAPVDAGDDATSPVAPAPSERVRRATARSSRVDDATAPRGWAGSAETDWPLLPRPRGALSDVVVSALRRPPGTMGNTPPVSNVDALRDDDFALALYLCYELHYRGVTDAGWEWDLDLLGFRAELERAFLNRLRDEVVYDRHVTAAGVVASLERMIAASSGPSLSAYVLDAASLEQLRELCVHRSAYQLKEADPHTFAIPRLVGEAKAALVEIQYDEYGSGRVEDMHSELFADTMVALDLDPTYGKYVEVIPGVTLATVNLVSMFALHRRWRGALVGHLAVVEMTSVQPMSRYSAALARLGGDAAARRFFDVHVARDAQHAVIARDRLVAGLVAAEPYLGADVLFGAGCVLALEESFTRHLLDAWSHDQSSLSPWEATPRGLTRE